MCSLFFRLSRTVRAVLFTFLSHDGDCNVQQGERGPRGIQTVHQPTRRTSGPSKLPIVCSAVHAATREAAVCAWSKSDCPVSARNRKTEVLSYESREFVFRPLLSPNYEIHVIVSLSLLDIPLLRDSDLATST